MTSSSTIQFFNRLSSPSLVRNIIGIMCTTLLLPIMLLLPTRCSSSQPPEVELPHAKFQKIALKGKAYGILDIDYSVYALETCIIGCLQKRIGTGELSCEAVEYKEDRKLCTYFTLSSGISDDDKELWEFQDRGKFLTVHVGGKAYSYHLSTETMRYFAARDYCRARGGYLVEIDSLDEYAALKMVGGSDPDIAYFIGITDIAEEGKFVTDRHGKPVDPTLLRFRSSVPDPATKNDEDVLSYRLKDGKLNDFPHNANKLVACERDP